MPHAPTVGDGRGLQQREHAAHHARQHRGHGDRRQRGQHSQQRRRDRDTAEDDHRADPHTEPVEEARVAQPAQHLPYPAHAEHHRRRPGPIPRSPRSGTRLINTACEAQDANASAITRLTNGRLRMTASGRTEWTGVVADGGHGSRRPTRCAGTVTTARTAASTR